MKKPFSYVGALKPGRTLFDLSYDKLVDVDMGELHVAQCDEVVPGDIWQQWIEAVIRMQPAIAPFLHYVEIVFYSWFVPYRLVDENWEEFISQWNLETRTETDVQLPRWEPPVGGYDVGTLWDDLGFPTGLKPTKMCCPIDYPRRAYNLIYNEFIRDENYQDEVSEDNATLLRINWEKDMFTALLPFQQRGTAPAVPLSGEANVKFTFATDDGQMPVMKNYYEDNIQGPHIFVPPYGLTDTGSKSPGHVYANEYEGTIPNNGYKANDAGRYITKTSVPANGNAIDNTSYLGGNKGQTAGFNPYVQPYITNDDGVLPPALAWQKWLSENNYIDLGSIGQMNATDMRIMLQVQKWMERNARSGVRYTEFLSAHFGVHPRDDRLQRPEYLGGHKAPLVVSEVVQTSSTDSETPQGNLAGHGLIAARGNITKYHVLEYGLIMTLFAIRPKAVYTQGIDRQWLRRTAFDFFFPEFVNLSEQGVEAEELFVVDQDSETKTSEQLNREVIGYIGRYDEMRSKRSIACGKMRTTFNYWTLAREFDSRPAINSEFITCNPTKRVFAVQEGEKAFICHIGNKIKAARPMPLIAEPGLLDHH